MSTLSGEYAKATNSIADTCADTSVLDDDENWFSQGCKRLYDGKAGTALWAETGFDERSCRRYAAGHIKPPAYFLRKLLRSDQGWTWLGLVMDGSRAAWWIEIQRARRIAEAIRGEL